MQVFGVSVDFADSVAVFDVDVDVDIDVDEEVDIDVDIEFDEDDAPLADVFVSETTNTVWRSRMIQSNARVTR